MKKRMKTNMPIWWYCVIYIGIILASLLAEYMLGDNGFLSAFITFNIFFVVTVIYIESGTFRDAPDMWFPTEKTDRIYNMLKRWYIESQQKDTFQNN